MTEIGLVTAFGAGLLSFLSPCVLPIIPGYLSFISGYGLAEIKEGRARGRIMLRTTAFVLGFSAVFVLLGMLFTGGGMALGFGGGATAPVLGPTQNGTRLADILPIASGAVVIFLGLNMIFNFLRVLNLEARFHPGKAPGGLFGSFVIGMAFAAGWSPCVGPILASILLYAARDGNLGSASLLLSFYSLGLGLPFLAAGLFFESLKPLLDFFKRHAAAIRIGSGMLLVLIGAFMALGKLSLVSSIAARLGFVLKEGLVVAPERLSLGFGIGWLILGLLPWFLAALRQRLPRPFAIALSAALIAASVLEITGVIGSAGIIAEWLLFQGA